MSLILLEVYPRPVLSRRTAGCEQILHGFEGGRCLKAGEAYHLLVSEMTGDPKFTRTRLAHWTSIDLRDWQRVSTLYESSGDHTGADPRAALFLPQPVYDGADQRWNLFYAAFRTAPNVPGKWLLNHDGRIWRAVSQTPGRGGIGGPYRDVGIILEPGPESDEWEGLQGVDSFFPYRAGEAWYAFYGSARTQDWPCRFWGVGLARADRLAGPWRRCSDRNPVPISDTFVENPIVTRLGDGTYLAVFDGQLSGRALGYTTSPDGLTWSPARHLSLEQVHWLEYTRTPLGLLPRPDGTFDLLFTGLDKTGYNSVGLLWCAWG